jgi:hypothetical protein
MSNKLTKDEIKAKKKYHNKRCEYYTKKLKNIKIKEKKIGFKHY